jgi:hypothetical protein
MRKFNLYDKVTVLKKKRKKKGCIVGFVTIEKDENIIDKESESIIEPQEHCYYVLFGQVDFNSSNAVFFEECMESEISLDI